MNDYFCDVQHLKRELLWIKASITNTWPTSICFTIRALLHRSLPLVMSFQICISVSNFIFFFPKQVTIVLSRNGNYENHFWNSRALKCFGVLVVVLEVTLEDLPVIVDHFISTGALMLLCIVLFVTDMQGCSYKIG